MSALTGSFRHRPVCHCQSIVPYDAEISHRAFGYGVQKAFARQADVAPDAGYRGGLIALGDRIRFFIPLRRGPGSSAR